MGRPPTKPAKLKNGFYLELKTQGGSTVMIRRDTKEQLLLAIEEYSRSKIVNVLGEMKDDKWISI